MSAVLQAHMLDTEKEAKCDALVEQYVPLVIAEMDNEITVDKVCVRFHICPPSPDEPNSAVDLTPATPKDILAYTIQEALLGEAVSDPDDVAGAADVVGEVAAVDDQNVLQNGRTAHIMDFVIGRCNKLANESLTAERPPRRSAARAPPNGAASSSPASASARFPCFFVKEKAEEKGRQGREARMEANKKASNLRKTADEEVDEVEEVDGADEEEVAVAMGRWGTAIVDPRLCFWSRETDDNPASCITGRVRVKRVKPPSGPKEPLDIPGDVDFVYHYMYSYDFASFSDIPNDECEQKLDCLPDPPAVHPSGSNGVNGTEESEKHEVARKAECNGMHGGDGGEKAVQSKEEEGATGKDESGLGDECVDAEGGGGRSEGGMNELVELEDKKADGKTEGTAVEGVKVESGGAVGGVSEVGVDNQEQGEEGKGENGKGEKGKGESGKGNEGKEVEGKAGVKVEDPAVGSMNVENGGPLNDAGETGDNQKKREKLQGENGKGEDGKKEEGQEGMKVESGGAVEGAGGVGDQEKDEEGKQEEGTGEEGKGQEGKGEEGKGEKGRKEGSEGNKKEEDGKEDQGEKTSKAASAGKKGRLSGGGARAAAAPATVTLPPQTMRLRMLDMYSGCGAMSTGIEMGGTPRGVTIDTCWSVDFNAAACESMKYNHPALPVPLSANAFLPPPPLPFPPLPSRLPLRRVPGDSEELPTLLERYAVSSGENGVSTAAAAAAVFMDADGEKGGKAVAHKHKVVHHSHHQHQEEKQQHQEQDQEQGGEGSKAKVENTKEVEMGDAEEAAGVEETKEEIEEEIEEVEAKGRGKRKGRVSADEDGNRRTSGRNKRQKSNGAAASKGSYGKESGKTQEEDEESSDEEIDEGEFEVGRIVGVRYIAATEKGRPAGIYFKVQWKGYGPEEDTWEAEESLGSCKLAIRDYLVEVKEKKLLPLPLCKQAIRDFLVEVKETKLLLVPQPGDVDIICGGPPCQGGVSGFNRFRNTEDPLACEKNRQLIVFMDLVGWLAPTWVLMENVVDLMKFKEGILAKYAIARLVAMGYKNVVDLMKFKEGILAKSAIARLFAMGYKSRTGIIAAGCFGVAQFRLRAFFFGALDGHVFKEKFSPYSPCLPHIPLLSPSPLPPPSFSPLPLLSLPSFPVPSPSPLLSCPPLPSQALPSFPLPTHLVAKERGSVPTRWMRNFVGWEEKSPVLKTLKPALVLKDVISDLPPVTNATTTDVMEYTKSPANNFQRFIRLPKSAFRPPPPNGTSPNSPWSWDANPKLLDHRTHNLNADDFYRVERIPKREGACFRDLPGVLTDPVTKKCSLDKTLQPRPFIPHSGSPLCPDYAISFVKGTSFKYALWLSHSLTLPCFVALATMSISHVGFGFRELKLRPFARLWWNDTVPTVVTRPEPHNQKILHPEQDRVLTVRENARLQGFPDHYKLFGDAKER
ncbi:unnamed protein product [Closterium sp. NIES-64]|nr:unnamed protein product [Closterium sp. NIES-64]